MKTQTFSTLPLLYFIAIALLLASQHVVAQVPCDAGKVIICHKGKNTLCVSENAVPAHLAHGDFVGACEGTTCDVVATGGTITCTTQTVQLLATSSAVGASFSWVGPGGFTSTQQNPNTATPGTYIVTAAVTGCTSSDTVVVSINTTPPDLTTSNAIITCNNTTATLLGSSTIGGSTFRWSGPNGVTSTNRNLMVSAVGSYTLAVTNPANGCTSSTSAAVVQNTTPPGVTAVASGMLTCGVTTVTVSASSPTSGVLYKWVGPDGFFSNQQSPATSVPGSYVITVTNPANGCTSSTGITVSQNAALPAGVTATASGMITCINKQVTLQGASTTPGVGYSWTGAGGVVSTAQAPQVNAPGSYMLKVSNPVNGCSTTATVHVQQDLALPVGVSATAFKKLTCTTPTVVLTGNSVTSGVSFSWAGPGGFTSVAAQPSVSEAGTYVLRVTNPVNGCSTTANVTVQQNNSQPANVIATTTGSLTCSSPFVTLSGMSTTAGVAFSWQGPFGFISSQQVVDTTIPGGYILTVTNPVNGCSAVATLNVLKVGCDP